MNLKTIKYFGAAILVSLSAAGPVLAQSGNDAFPRTPVMPGVSPVVGLVAVAIWLLVIVAMWKVFTKAGQPGWASIIPFYNVYVLIKVGGKPGWWLILCLIPIVNIIILLMVSLGIAKNFGKGAGFGVGLFFLGIIFYPVLAFSDATYQVPAGA